MTKEKRKRAAALRYDAARDHAPVVLAAGQGKVAEEIMARAKAAGIPLNKDPELVECLCRIPVGQQIPSELYQAVAEVLAFIFRVNAED